MAPFATVDAYLAAQSAQARPILKRVLTVLKKALPGATAGISYNIPVVKLGDTMIVFFAGHKDHYAIYPSTPALLKTLAKELAPRLKGRSIHFSYDETLPTHLIGRIATVRAAEAKALAAARAKKKGVKKKVTKKKAATKKAVKR